MTVPPKLKPGFVPDGHVSLFDALCVLGEAMFGDEWTGKEVHARTLAQRREDVQRSMRAKRRTVFRPNRDGGAKKPAQRRLSEAKIAELGARFAAIVSAENVLRKRRDAVSQSLQQMAQAEKVKPVILTKAGEIIPIRPRVFRSDDAPKIFDTGRALSPVEGVHVEGWVLFAREELAAAIRSAYPSWLKGEPAVSLADPAHPADQLSAKTEPIETPEPVQDEDQLPRLLGRPTCKAEIKVACQERLEAGEGAERAAAMPTKAATNKMFVDLHQDFLDDYSRPATVEESYKLVHSIGVRRDRARVLRRGLPSHLKNKRRRPSQK